MSILRQIMNLFHRSKLDQEIEAELRSHISAHRGAQDPPFARRAYGFALEQ
jgi:hypothetical protein